MYKFRIPLGDRTNYDHVIFNDGTAKNGGGNETKVIDYSAGTLYYADRTNDSHTYKQSTDIYETRGDYLYIRTQGTAAWSDCNSSGGTTKWDDLHITFYDASGTRILQGGTGYVMKYAGTADGHTYFKIPVPQDAKKFRLNDGYETENNYKNHRTGTYDILEKVDSAPSDGQTLGGMLYTLSGTTLTLDEPTVSVTSTTTPGGTYPITYTPSPRGDYICIRDDANLFSGTAPTVTFKDGAGITITKSVNGGSATENFMTVNKHDNGGSDQWYSFGIPVEAASFTLTYGSNQTIEDQQIYAKTGSTTGTDSNFTTGSM